MLRKIGRFVADMAIFQVQGPDSVMQYGASPGSCVGDTNDWILFLWFILIVVGLLFRSATSHPVRNTQKHHFLTQNTTFFTHKRLKKSIFLKVRIFLSHDAGDCQMAAVVAPVAFMPPPASSPQSAPSPPTIQVGSGGEPPTAAQNFSDCTTSAVPHAVVVGPR